MSERITQKVDKETGTGLLYLDGRPIAYHYESRMTPPLSFLAYDRVDETDDTFWRNELHPTIQEWAGPDGIVVATSVCDVDAKHRRYIQPEMEAVQCQLR